jgi:(2Fe-2S) ferredoxin
MSDRHPHVTLCRTCCCGATRKHSDVDHDRQLRILRGALDDKVEVRQSDCLRACDHSNVFVVHPSTTARAAGAKPVWLGRVLDEDALNGVVEWLRSGGPGITPAPPSIRGRTITPPNQPDPPPPG